MDTNDLKSTAKDTAGRAAQAARDTADTVREGAQTYAGRAKDAAGHATDAAKDAYGHARDTAKAAADSLPEHLSDTLDASQRAYRQTRRTVARQVGKQPVEALLLAGAIGYLVGWATNR